jgi:hypothetical protein
VYQMKCIFTLGLILCHISIVNIVLALLYTEDSDDITAANITAIIIPTIPVGNRLNTNLEVVVN